MAALIEKVQDVAGGAPEAAPNESSKIEPATPSPSNGAPSPAAPSAAGQIVVRVLRYGLGHLLPLYVIVASVCFIAVTNVWPLYMRQPAVVQPPIASQPVQPSAATAVAPPVSSDVKVTDVAKMAIDATKERVDMMKESYDKLFSLIAAFGALLAFFGFKGIETFMAARAKAEETLAKAQEAVAQANDAKRQADAAKSEAEKTVRDLEDFVRVRYSRDNNAEGNVAHGIVLREIADVYKDVMRPETCDSSEAERVMSVYHQYLHESATYLERVVELEREEGIDKRVVSRAYGTLGNINNRLGKPEKALECAQKALRAAPDDHSAQYNVACYHARVSTSVGRRAAEQQRSAAVSALELAIGKDRKYRKMAVEDPDFASMRDDPDFKRLVS